MTCGVYEIVIVATDERYIGSSVNVRGRWGKHRYDLRHGKHLVPAIQAAYDKDGLSGLAFNILERCDDSVVREREQHYIDAADNPLNSEMKCDKKLIHLSEEAKRKISENRTITDEAREAWSEAATGNTFRRNGVYVKYTDGREVIYDTQTAAAEAVGISGGGMSSWLSGKTTTWKRAKYGIAEIRRLTS